MNMIANKLGSVVLHPLESGNKYLFQPSCTLVRALGRGLGYVEDSLDSLAGRGLDALHLRPHSKHGEVTAGTADRMFRMSLLSMSVASRLKSTFLVCGSAGVAAGSAVVEASPSMWGTVSRIGGISIKFLPLKDLSGQVSGLASAVSQFVFGLGISEKAEGLLSMVSSLNGVTESADRLSGAAKDLGVVESTLRGAAPFLGPVLAIMTLASVVLQGVNFHRKYIFREEMLDILGYLKRDDASGLYTRSSLKTALEKLQTDENGNQREAKFFKSRFKLSRDLNPDLQNAIARLDNVADATIQQETEELLTQLRGRLSNGMLTHTVSAVASLTGSVATQAMVIAPAAPIGGVLLTACLTMFLASGVFSMYNYTFQPIEIKSP